MLFGSGVVGIGYDQESRGLGGVCRREVLCCFRLVGTCSELFWAVVGRCVQVLGRSGLSCGAVGMFWAGLRCCGACSGLFWVVLGCSGAL